MRRIVGMLPQLPCRLAVSPYCTIPTISSVDVTCDALEEMDQLFKLVGDL